MQNIQLQVAFVLHTRAYRDTSLIVEFFTPDYGRLSAVARGVRKRKNLKRSLFNPFIPLLISVQGKGSLKLLTHVEAAGKPVSLIKKSLFAGLYVNELLNRLLPEWDAHHVIYQYYYEVMLKLEEDAPLEPILRCFEMQLLNELGYGIDWYNDAELACPIVPGELYQLDAGSGFTLAGSHSLEIAQPHNVKLQRHQFRGDDILAIAAGNYHLAEVRKVAKKINRLLLRPLLGSKPLQARSLFQ